MCWLLMNLGRPIRSAPAADMLIRPPWISTDLFVNRSTSSSMLLVFPTAAARTPKSECTRVADTDEMGAPFARRRKTSANGSGRAIRAFWKSNDSRFTPPVFRAECFYRVLGPGQPVPDVA